MSRLRNFLLRPYHNRCWRKALEQHAQHYKPARVNTELEMQIWAFGGW